MDPASSPVIISDLVADLVTANRILARRGVLDAWGHVSVRHPAHADRFLLSRARAPALVTADDIMEFDLDSEPIEQTGRRLFLERFIHGEIYRARPDVHAVVHSHSPTMIPFGVTGEPLRAVSHMASFLTQEAPVWDISEAGLAQGLRVCNCAQARSLARKLGGGALALMRGHGNVVVAPDVRRVVLRALYAEINAQQLAAARTFSRHIRYLAPEEAHDPARLDDAWEVWREETADSITSRSEQS